MAEDSDKLKKLLHDLTPGGSEFVDDPERCAEYIKETRHSQHRLIVKYKTQRDWLVEALEAIRVAVANNAAPMNPEYALTQVDMVWLSSDLVLDALKALAVAKGN